VVPGAVIAVFLVTAVVAWSMPDVAPEIGPLALVFGLFMVASLIIKRSAVLPERERAAWRFVAGGLVLLAVGVVVVGVLVLAGFDLPTFGPVDTLFLSAYCLMIVALYKLARLDSGGREWVLTLLDGAVAGIALSALVWNAFFEELVQAVSGAPWWEAAIAIFYPVVDIAVVVALMMLVVRRSHYHFDRRLVFFALGGSVQVLADFVYLNQSVGRQFTGGEPAWGLLLIAGALMTVTAATVDQVPAKREFPEGPTPVWALMWPYLMAALLLAVHFQNYRKLGPVPSEIVLLDAVIVIGVVLFLRQVYVIYRDRRRVDTKRAELVASVSHELRTPLTGMVGFLSLLDEHPEEFPAEMRREMIAEASGQARHMSRLVADLLLLAREETARIELVRQEVNALPIVLSVLKTANPGSVSLEDELELDVRVNVDPDRLRQALSNLISNAIRYGGDRCLVVGRTDGNGIVLEVHDNGSGVPTRYEDRIWDHFERGAHRLDSTTPGLGIGLSVVQAVAQAHGGSAEYRMSERLGGACFRVSLPGVVAVGTEEPAYR
jgi:signal transduction histidine kinase